MPWDDIAFFAAVALAKNNEVNSFPKKLAYDIRFIQKLGKRLEWATATTNTDSEYSLIMILKGKRFNKQALKPISVSIFVYCSGLNSILL